MFQEYDFYHNKSKRRKRRQRDRRDRFNIQWKILNVEYTGNISWFSNDSPMPYWYAWEMLPHGKAKKITANLKWRSERRAVKAALRRGETDISRYYLKMPYWN